MSNNAFTHLGHQKNDEKYKSETHLRLKMKKKATQLTGKLHNMRKDSQ